MKKFNGTDYDGLLPLAYNALNSQQLDGKTFDEIQNLFTSNASGSYVGNGKYGENNPVVINCGFKPKILMLYYLKNDQTPERYFSLNGNRYSANKINLGYERLCSSLADTVNIPLGALPSIFYFNSTTFLYNSFSVRNYYKVFAYIYTKFNLLDSGLSFYCESVENCGSDTYNQPQDRRSAEAQYNESGRTYYYIVFR